MGVSVSSAKKSCRACWQTLNGSKRRLEVRQTMRCLAGQMRPCRSVPEVEAWEATFETVQFRCNFLVLDDHRRWARCCSAGAVRSVNPSRSWKSTAQAPTRLTSCTTSSARTPWCCATRAVQRWSCATRSFSKRLVHTPRIHPHQSCTEQLPCHP